MTELLKPCPFCGGAANGVIIMKFGAVMCDACGYIIDRNSPGKAIAAWNTRTDAARIEELEGFIRDFAATPFNTLPCAFIADPRDRPDDATDLAAVLAWQDDALDLLKGGA